jgi:hypothetical protein
MNESTLVLDGGATAKHDGNATTEALAIARNKGGTPPKEKTKGEYLDVRLDSEEKHAFKDAADLAGLPLSTWVRLTLRQTAKKQCFRPDSPVAFLGGNGKKLL